MTQVSVESADAKVLLPGYITVVVVSARAKSSGITEGAHLAIPPPFCQVTITLREDSRHNELALAFPRRASPRLVRTRSQNMPKSGQRLTISGVNIYCNLFES